MVSSELCDLLAVAIEYPQPTTAQSADRARELLTPMDDGLGAALEALSQRLREDGLHAAEERYTRLFDLKPVCTLNLAWHLFGDTYDRGALLAQLVPELEAHEVPHRHDLPDYLPTLLRLLGRLSDEEDRQLLTHAVILPGLKKVRRALGDSPDPWSRLLTGLPDLLERQVPKHGRTDIPVPRRPLEVIPPC